MSEHRSDPPPPDSDSGGGLSVRLVLFVIVAAALVVFIFQNTSSEPVQFLGFESEPPLWVSLFLAAIGGAIVGQFVAWLVRRSRRSG